MKYLLLCLFIGLSICTANAAIITSNTTSITSMGQLYNSTVTLHDIDYADIYIDITAKGDFGYDSDESFMFYIDDVLLATWTFNSVDGVSIHDFDGVNYPLFVTENAYAVDYTLTGTFALSASQWNLFSEDDILNISWKNAPSVNPFVNIGGSDYVSYSLSGAVVSVDEPSVLAMLLFTFIVLSLTRKKRLSL